MRAHHHFRFCLSNDVRRDLNLSSALLDCLDVGGKIVAEHFPNHILSGLGRVGDALEGLDNDPSQKQNQLVVEIILPDPPL